MLAFYSNKARGADDSVYYLVGIDKARFKRPVLAGDQLRLEAVLTRELRGIYRFEATAKVEDKVVATAELMTTERSTES